VAETTANASDRQGRLAAPGAAKSSLGRLQRLLRDGG